MTAEKRRKIFALVGDAISSGAILLVIACFWCFYFISSKSVDVFIKVEKHVEPILLLASLPFVLGLCWLHRRYGKIIDKRTPVLLRGRLLLLIVFISIATPVVLIKLSQK